jgi:hypothetical protein
VPDEAIARLVAAAEGEGVHLHRLDLDHIPTLAIAVAAADAQEMADPAYRSELIRWSNRPQWSGDGVPAGTTVNPARRRVPVRTLAMEPNRGMPVPNSGDRGSAYLVLYGEDDTAPGWLSAGVGLSAVLLTIVTFGLSAAPMSDVIEVDRTRAMVRGLLPGAGAGAAYIVIRCGTGRPATDLPAAPRRDPFDVIHNLPVQ